MVLSKIMETNKQLMTGVFQKHMEIYQLLKVCVKPLKKPCGKKEILLYTVYPFHGKYINKQHYFPKKQ